jgi:mannose-6-phosphate isomerase-like protein (cupin superfamily)
MTEPRAGVVIEGDKLRMEFVVTSAESGGDLHQMRVTYGPRSDPPPSHLHPAQDETFEILEGTVEFVLDGVRSEHTAPAVVEVPAGTVHQLRNPTDAPATVLWSTRPALRTGEFFLALHEAAGDIERVVAVLTEYDDVFCLADHPS